MTRTYIVLATLALAMVTACASPAAQITDDALVEPEVAERVNLLREQVDHYEGRSVLERDRNALGRMRDWLEEMADSSEDEAAIYEAAVRAQLDFLRTTELRYYPDEAD